MTAASRPFAIVTGASSGIGYELARCCVEREFDLLIEIAPGGGKIGSDADNLIPEVEKDGFELHRNKHLVFDKKDSSGHRAKSVS